MYFCTLFWGPFGAPLGFRGGFPGAVGVLSGFLGGFEGCWGLLEVLGVVLEALGESWRGTKKMNTCLKATRISDNH